MKEEAIERIKKLMEVIEKTRSQSTGMTFIIFELKQILKILGDSGSLADSFLEESS